MTKRGRDHAHLSRRERQIMDVVYSCGRASAAQVLEGLPDPPSYSAVRAMLRILEGKGILRHEKEGPRYIYVPTVPRGKASRSAVKRLVQTFFDGSVERAVAALLNNSDTELSDEQLDNLAGIIEQAKKEGR